MTSKELAHKPVLINEIIKLTRPKDNETYFDATFGNGGYSKEFRNSFEYPPFPNVASKYVSLSLGLVNFIISFIRTGL